MSTATVPSAAMQLAHAARHPTGALGPSPFGPVPATIDTGVSILDKETVKQYKRVPAM